MTGHRLSRWKLAEILGRRRNEAFAVLRHWDVIPAPGDDGRWSPSIEERIRHAMKLGGEARRLDRRVLLLHRDGYAVSRFARRNALASVLSRVSRPAHKVSQVLWELDAFTKRPVQQGRRRRLRALSLPPSRWGEVMDARISSDVLFDRWFQWTATFVGDIARAASERTIGITEPVPYEERLGLVLMIQLLSERHVRNRLGLAQETT